MEEVKDKFERRTQLCFGIALFAYFVYSDDKSGFLLSDPGLKEGFIAALRYMVATLFITNLTFKQASELLGRAAELIRAYRSGK